MARFKGIVKLSETQFNTLSTVGTLTVGGTTYTYEPDTTVYVTPDTTQSQLNQITARLNQVDQSIAGKQNTLSAGTGISISSNTISMTGALPYLTTAPTSANADGLKLVVLSSEPTTKYSGYIYIITE